MTLALQVNGDARVDGDFSARTMSIPAAAISNLQMASSAAVEATKLQHQHTLTFYIPPATAITAQTIPLWICRGLTASIIAIQAAIVGTIATGADRTVTVDLKAGNAGGAYATVLSSTIGFTNVSALRTVGAGVISTPAMAVGDSLQLAVAVAGAAGNQALGLLVTVTVREDAS